MNTAVCVSLASLQNFQNSSFQERISSSAFDGRSILYGTAKRSKRLNGKQFIIDILQI